MKNPHISIITASYNSDKTIGDTLKSVLSQSFSHYEYIIVDGASSDKTVDIIKKYEPAFNGKLKWISESDAGIYDAWNKGIQQATGEWICFVGSDDVLLPNALLSYYREVEKDANINFVSSRIELVDYQMKYLCTIGLPWSSKMKRYCCIAHVGSWHKKTLFKTCGLYSLKYQICSDYEFLLRNYDKIIPGYIDTVTIKMRNDGVSNANQNSAFKETYLIKNNCGVNLKCWNYLFFLKTMLGYWVKVYLKRV